MRILKPSKRPGKGRLNSQTDSIEHGLDDAGSNASDLFSEEILGTDESNNLFGSDEQRSNSRRPSKGNYYSRKSKRRSGRSSGESDSSNAELGARGQRGLAASADGEQVGAEKSLSDSLDERKKLYLSIQTSAVRSLAMREHSVQELREKLVRKFELNLDVVDAVLDQLVEDGYVSDERFAESYVRARRNKGVGPVKIKSELYRKGVSDHLIADYLEPNSAVWLEAAEHEHRKKFGGAAVADYREWTKRARFLQGRGFTMEHIHVTVPQVEAD
ncbi:hypothetical protein GCM10008090_19310 [Arenicella chitinivorans]|uniref:Regulatory protein RecX n=1 Tax=Arenicella chitinivorans TaxID=1329800 RepID=A0A918RRK0_9GAMM|nr:regulatory protein RecX [Arenicella chitinivorans]GHA09437.1 hypothetical protein GCM10008090_19310 [Arenicella chitinivorans]